MFPVIDFDEEKLNSVRMGKNKTNRLLRKTGATKKMTVHAAHAGSSGEHSGMASEMAAAMQEVQNESLPDRAYEPTLPGQPALSPKSALKPGRNSTHLRRANSDSAGVAFEVASNSSDEDGLDSEEREMREEEAQEAQAPQVMISGRNGHLAKMMSVKRVGGGRGGGGGMARGNSTRGMAGGGRRNSDAGVHAHMPAFEEAQEEEMLRSVGGSPGGTKKVGFGPSPGAAPSPVVTDKSTIDVMHQR